MADVVCSEEAEGLAKRLKLRFYRASVKEDLNVNEGEFIKLLLCSAQRSETGCCVNTFFLFFFLSPLSVFKYLADKYLQQLKQQTAEETEVVHTTSNKIGRKHLCVSVASLTW